MYSLDGSFEGDLGGVRVWSSFVRWLEGLADGRVRLAQGTVWRCPIGTGIHSAGDGSTVPRMVAQGSEVMEGTCSAHLASWFHPGRVPG
jgi:hypothetical protein